MVYKLLGDEMAQAGGIHALQIKTQTVEEYQRISDGNKVTTESSENISETSGTAKSIR